MSKSKHKSKKQTANTQTIISVGGDIAKDKIDIYIMGSHMGQISSFKIKNNAKGIGELIKKLEGYQKDKDYPVVFEATGSYHFLASLLLKEAGYSVIPSCDIDHTDEGIFIQFQLQMEETV